MSQEIETNNRVYTPIEVVDTFAGEVQTKHIRTLVEHLTNPKIAIDIESVRELGNIIELKVIHRWIEVRDGQNILNYRFKYLTTEEVDDLTRNGVGDSFREALKLRFLAFNMQQYFKTFNPKIYKQVYEGGDSFDIKTDGGLTATYKPTTPYVKDMVSQFNEELEKRNGIIEELKVLMERAKIKERQLIRISNLSK